jgi:hypothetical protein
MAFNKSIALASLAIVSQAGFLDDPELDDLSFDWLKLKSYTNCNIDHIPEVSKNKENLNTHYVFLLVQRFLQGRYCKLP